jgi:soluble lytic murein transglycosylase
MAAGLVLAVVPAGTAATPRHDPAKKAQPSDKKPSDAAAASRTKQAGASHAKKHRESREEASKKAHAAPVLDGELGVIQKAVGLARKGKLTEARDLARSIDDPVAKKLIEWAYLRGDNEAGFERYDAFIRANPDWPGIGVFRRRAEGRLWYERRDAATVRAFTGGQPTSAKGRFALARVLMGEGDRAGAEREIRAAWHAEELSAESETAVLEAFGDVLTRADHAARMDRFVGRKDFGIAMRAARRVGDDAVKIVKACASAESNSKGAGKLLDGVPGAARNDPAYILCRIHVLQKQPDGIATATQLMLSVPPDALRLQDGDEWWRERRLLARKQLDLGDAKTAYRLVSAAAPPDNPFYQADVHFMAGWIALRYLSDPATALAHFEHVDDGSINPLVLSRAAYWRGRAFEALGQSRAMRKNYEDAARHSTAYYGQLARERLGLGEPELRQPVGFALASSSEIVHAAELLYTVGERELVLSFMTDLAERSDDVVVLSALADLAARNGDARTVMLVGKAALGRGLPLEKYAFPDIGVPSFAPVGPALARSIVYSVVRTESEFNQADKSAAKAVGLMQVTPEAGRDTAKRFNVHYDWKKMVSDPVYNTQMGAAEISALLQDYRGNYIMSFAGYNAGRGRVQEWVAKHGDPRDAKVDAVDWVERIPFSETRNYVQRVMENMLVYRVRFGEGQVATQPEGGAKNPPRREAVAR